MKPIPMQGIDDCWRACLASLLEVNYENVPYFGTIQNLDPDWFDKSLSFIRERGLNYMEFKLGNEDPEHKKRTLHGYHVIVGQSKLYPGFKHAIIGLNGEIAWDPNPREGAGIVPGTEVYGVFTAMDPGRWKPEAK